MNFSALILFGLVCAAMVVGCLRSRNHMYEFPLWAGILALGWFLPQAIGGWFKAGTYPDGAYANGMFFAALCMLALWGGFYGGRKLPGSRRSWLDARFENKRLFQSGVVLCLIGYYFHWKLTSLPDEVLAQTQWSGLTVRYLFLASVFAVGFITLWLVYLSRRKWMAPRFLIFIVPGLLLLLESAVLAGRRAAMMNLIAYVLIGLWLVRRMVLPRWVLVCGLVAGMLLINSIGIYRSIMADKEEPLGNRIREAVSADYLVRSKVLLEEGGGDFDNYVYLRQVVAEDRRFDWGLAHWNGLVFNYVPAQIVGQELKRALMIPLQDDAKERTKERYGHRFGTGGTVTGYMDAFASFGWMGWVKFAVIGWIMGVLYRHAMRDRFLGQLLYVYMFNAAMHAISHGTQTILVSQWVYFFVLGYPVLYWAKVRNNEC
jgi:hypothetical protein